MEFGRLPLRDWVSAPWLMDADPGRSTRREIRSSSSALLSDRPGIGDTIYINRILEPDGAGHGAGAYLEVRDHCAALVRVLGHLKIEQKVQARVRTSTGLWLGLLGHGLLLPLGLGLLDQALLACVLMLDLCALRNGVERRLVVNTVDKTGDESRVAEDLSIRKVVNVRSRMG